MRSMKLNLAILIGICAMNAQAQDVQQCDAALAPTIERAASDYALAQSYMYVNAVQEYDKLKKSSAAERGASASYKFFSAEYNDSKSASEFQEKIRSRLVQENYSMQESESRSSYRRFLSGPQLLAWSECVRSVSKGGALIMNAESVSDSAFPIRVRWYPQAGVGTGTLLLKLKNATIDDKNEISVLLNGVSEKPFIVVPDPSTNQVVLTAEIVGAADVLALPRKFPAAVPPPKVQLVATAPKAKTKIQIPASDFVRPENVALGGPNNIYGPNVLLNGPPYNDRPNAAEFDFTASAAGTYLLKIEYAAATARPVTVSLNKVVAIPNAMNAPTGCWEVSCQLLLNQGNVTLREGANTLRVHRGSVFPHIRTFVFEPVE